MIIKTIKSISAIFAIYATAVLGTQGVTQFTSPSIKSVDRLAIVIEREKRHLNCDILIEGHLKENLEARSINRNNNYSIELGGIAAAESTATHEVFHICDGPLYSMETDFLMYTFWAEPRATFYAASRYLEDFSP